MNKLLIGAAIMFAGAAVCFAGGITEKSFEPGTIKVGCNYWGSKAGVHMWRAQDWDEKEIEKDLAALASNGVEVLRIFPTWSEFQPLQRNWRYQAMPGEYLEETTDKPVYDPHWIEPGALSRLRFFCDTAKKNNIKLVVSMVTGWMSGRLFVPRAVDGLNLITDPEALQLEGRFARALVRAMKNHTAIIAWDLGNECNCMGAVESQAQAWNWLNTISSAIRMEDSTRPVVSGMHSQTSNAYGTQFGKANYWTLQMQGELLDVLTPHPYPAAFRIEANRGPFNSFRNALHPVSQCLFYEGISGKVAFPQEVGSLGPRMSPEWMAAKGMRQQIFASYQHGLPAYLWWCAFDQMHLGYSPFNINSMERELGMLKADDARSPKPQALALKAFREFRDSLPFKKLPARQIDAVCVLSERQEFYHQAFGALMLSKQAGFDVTFAPAESRKLPESNFYILPSGDGWEVYSQEIWEELIARVHRGATLLVSRGGDAGYSGWIDVSGLEQVLYHAGRTLNFELDGRKLSVGDGFTAVQTPVSCEVIAADKAKGDAVIAVKKLGKGKLISVNFAIEKCIIERIANAVDNNMDNELWRVYAFAAKTANVRRVMTKDDPRLVVTEHHDKDGRVWVLALNTSDRKCAAKVEINGEAGKVYNGKLERGVLEIAANDGAVIEVKTQE